ncbi:MAG TPA: HD domain-containing phosphohydrolase, partial [Ilumatobacteraceae bacterium]|nr:HD domain-containing phosphohydrolase [Ilumatobacteraceae bacterium]
MDYATAAQTRWQAHPGLARVLRAAIALLPVGLSVAMSLSAAHFLPPHRLELNKWLWWVLVGALSTVVLLGADRLLRRLLPLTALLKMTLIFPDQAPSRFRLAMRTGTTKQLEKLVEQASADGPVSTEIDRAARMLELVAALSAHDRLTRGHCERVRAYTDLLVSEMHLGEQETNLLRWSALLHDVGKLRVPQEILTSDKRPTDEEWRILATHPAEGVALTECLADWLGEWRRTIGEHHERWDGNGYPSGLGGSEIHLGARIVAVADAFDVMTSARSYKKPIPAAAAREEIARCSGTQFDPVVVRAFLSIGLRRLQFALGPLAWLSNLPVIGQAPLISAATNAIGGVVTAGVLTAATMGSPAAAQSQSHPPARIAEVAASPPTHPTTTTTHVVFNDSTTSAERDSTRTESSTAATAPKSTDAEATIPGTT